MAALLAGCAASGPERGFDSGPAPAPAENARVDPRHRPAVTTVDPGAERLVALIVDALDKAGLERRAYTSVGLWPLRNQSHATPTELEALTDRLARLLNAAGSAWGIEFYTDPSEAVDYELRGTIYLITARGFDQWELYLSLRPAGEGWSAWRSPGPIRVMRLPVAGAPQIIMPPES
jgi:hypothetical protein